MQRFQGIGTYATVGLDFAVAIAIGLYAGWWLDKKLGSTPWLMIIGLLFGVAAGTAAVMTPGTELCRREDAERLYECMVSGA